MRERKQSTFLEFDANVRDFQERLSQHSVRTEQVRNTPPSKGVGRYSGRLVVQPNYGQMRAAQA